MNEEHILQDNHQTVSQGALSRRYSASTFGTGIPSNPVAGSFGISPLGRITAGLNRIRSLFSRKSNNNNNQGSGGNGGNLCNGGGDGGGQGGNRW